AEVLLLGEGLGDVLDGPPRGEEGEDHPVEGREVALPLELFDDEEDVVERVPRGGLLDRLEDGPRVAHLDGDLAGRLLPALEVVEAVVPHELRDVGAEVAPVPLGERLPDLAPERRVLALGVEAAAVEEPAHLELALELLQDLLEGRVISLEDDLL